MLDIAIVGGGPGGLMAAWQLERKLRQPCTVRIYEASERLGGKVLTSTFASAPAMYEAGVAEFYDYSMTGPDPLRDLVRALDLRTVPMDADQVELDGALLRGIPGVRRHFGDPTAAAIESFRERCKAMLSPKDYYEGVSVHDNEHPWANLSCEELLEREVDDPVARRFLRVMVRSDTATESYNTTGLNALKNFLMDVDGYIGLYSIQGGNEELVRGLASRIDAQVHLRHRVLGVGTTTDGRYRLDVQAGEVRERVDADVLLLCLPHSWLATIRWDDEPLRRAMVEHVAYFDRPAHYLRIALLFDKPFWGDALPGAWFMSEAFGGCCVYVEGARHETGPHGVLNWLVPGADALAFGNLTDVELFDAALASLPPALGDARAHFLEGKTHRWMSSVNAQPGGLPLRDVLTNHRPAPREHPRLLVVGDYLFDSTLNGLLDSADAATDVVVSEIVRGRLARSNAARRTPEAAAMAAGPFRSAGGLARAIGLVWPRADGRSALVVGPDNDELVADLRSHGIAARGIEAASTELPFEDGAFDVAIETGLCRVAAEQTVGALRELHRVTRAGLVFGSVTSDLPFERIESYHVRYRVQRLGTWWEWSELFFANGFDLAIQRRDVLEQAWRALGGADDGTDPWYPNAESLRYSFFDRVADRDGVA